jgi:hypothetical protein
LNQQLSAKAFTTGQDIFFRQGAYDPGSGNGRELIAHELTHVVQQSTGAVSGGGGGTMHVNPPGDSFEQEADAMARQSIQREAMPEEEEMVQGKAIQREAMPEEEEMVQGKAIQREAMPEEEEMVQGKAIQREAMPEEEEMVQGKTANQAQCCEEDAASS